MKLRVLLTEQEIKAIIKQYIRSKTAAAGSIVVTKLDGEYAYRVGYNEEL